MGTERDGLFDRQTGGEGAVEGEAAPALSADELDDLFGDGDAPAPWIPPPSQGLAPGGLPTEHRAAPGPAPTGHARVPDLLDGLNPAQLEACTHHEGPLLILAGPGSGKTRVVTRRIAWLVTERGVRPDEVLAITFTNKAAREMRERVERVIGDCVPAARGLWVSTFHSTCARVLRREVEILGTYTRDFTIYDTSDRNQLLKRILKEQDLDTTRFRPGQVGSWISARKNGRVPGGEDTDGLLRDGGDV